MSTFAFFIQCRNQKLSEITSQLETLKASALVALKENGEPHLIIAEPRICDLLCENLSGEYSYVSFGEDHGGRFECYRDGVSTGLLSFGEEAGEIDQHPLPATTTDLESLVAFYSQDAFENVTDIIVRAKNKALKYEEDELDEDLVDYNDLQVDLCKALGLTPLYDTRGFDELNDSTYESFPSAVHYVNGVKSEWDAPYLIAEREEENEDLAADKEAEENARRRENQDLTGPPLLSFVRPPAPAKWEFQAPSRNSLYFYMANKGGGVQGIEVELSSEHLDKNTAAVHSVQILAGKNKSFIEGARAEKNKWIFNDMTISAGKNVDSPTFGPEILIKVDLEFLSVGNALLKINFLAGTKGAPKFQFAQSRPLNITNS